MHDHTLAKATAFDLAAHRAADPSNMPSRSTLPDTLVVYRPEEIMSESKSLGHWRTRLQGIPGLRDAGKASFYAIAIAAPNDTTHFGRELRADFYRPRNVAWTDYPILSDTLYVTYGLHRPAKHEHHMTLVGPFHALSSIRSASLQELRERIEKVILLPSGADGDDEWSRMAMDVMRRELPADVSFIDETCAPYRPVDRSTAHARFAYSYRVNMLGIGIQVLSHGVDVAQATIFDEDARSSPAADVNWRSVLGDDPIEAILDPLSLQFLAVLDDISGTDRRIVPFRELPVSIGAGKGWIWTGTGRHAGAPIDTGRVRRLFHASHRYDWFVCDHEAEGYRLSDTGRMVAARIPKAMRDRDVLCRWADAPDDMETRRSMDAWIVRSFRALKRVANDLRREGN